MLNRVIQIPKFHPEDSYNMLNIDPDIRRAVLEKKLKLESDPRGYSTLLGKRDFLGKKNLGISDLMNFEGSNQQEEEEIEYGDPSGIEPFMMLELEELTDIDRRKKKKDKGKKKGNLDQKEDINLNELLGLTNESNRSRIERREFVGDEGEKVIELDFRFTRSGFKGVIHNDSIFSEDEEREEDLENVGFLNFEDLVDITPKKKEKKKRNKQKKKKKKESELKIDDIMSAFEVGNPVKSRKKLKI